jgi:uncharacterized protein (UPF0218 family)
MQIKPRIIEELKKPQGILIPDTQITKETLNKYLLKAKKIISIGDRTTKNLLSFDIVPDISVIDGYERRKKSNYTDLKVVMNLRDLKKKPVLISCHNPRGTISIESISKIRRSLALRNPVILKIVGEEDLLALPFFLLAELDSVILYGQPLKGMVVVRVTNAIRTKAKRLIGMFETEL